MSDYGVFISASPSTIVFASARGLLGSPSAVAAFGHAMERHGIIVNAVSASAAAGHRRQVDVGVGGRGPESEDGFSQKCCSRRDPRVMAGGGCRKSLLGGRDRRGREGGVREAHGAPFFVIGFDWRPMTVIEDNNGGGHRGQRQQSTKAAVEEKVATVTVTAMVMAMVTGTKIN